jgi:hypothetical protein
MRPDALEQFPRKCRKSRHHCATQSLSTLPHPTPQTPDTKPCHYLRRAKHTKHTNIPTSTINSHPKQPAQSTPTFPQTFKMDPSNRATRPPPSRRAFFHASTRRPAAPSVVRPDTANLFPQTMDDELVERDEKGQYKVTSSMYKHLAQTRETDEEIGTFCIVLHVGGCEGIMLMLCDRARKSNHRVVWQAECALGSRGCGGGD